MIYLNRRNFFRGMGAGIAALPLASVLQRESDRAYGAGEPLKFVTLYHPHGVSAEYWAMKGTETETSFDISYDNCSLKPFDDATTYGKSYKDKILPIEGIDLLSNANGHDTAGTILTGSRIDGSKKPANISLDQYLAVEKGYGADTRVTSVVLGVGTDSADAGECLSFGAGGAAIPKIIDPVAAFDLLFAGLVLGDDPEASAKAELARKRGTSVLDFVRSDLESLKLRVSSNEKLKLDQHLTALRDIEKQFQNTTGMACTVPTRPSPYASLKRYNGGEPFFDAITDNFVDLIAQAFACDITRFATLYMNDLSYAGNPIGLDPDNHSAVAHTYSASTIGNDGHSATGTPATWIPLAKFNGYMYGKIARLMMKLDSFGILDSTIIYASSDMGNPSLHSTKNVPTLIAGGANGKFTMGRRLRVAADCLGSNEWCNPGESTYNPISNSKILVSIAQAFGDNINSFGTQPDVALTTGALSELG